MKDIASAWNKVVTWAHENEVDLIVQAGDVFDHPNLYGKEANVGTIYDAFMAPYKAQPKPVPMFLIPGNHDMGGPWDVDALAPFVRHPYITVSRVPKVVQVNDMLAVCAMPWVNRAQLMTKLIKKGETPQVAQEKVNKAISNLANTLSPEIKAQKEAGRFVLFVGHLEVTNARMANGEAQAGGSFEFNSTDLANLGCHAYALAHIHVRQHVKGLPNKNDGYLGPLCQLDFGEENQACGSRIIEFDGQKIISDEWMENDDSPQYFTSTSIHGLEYRKGVDYVKIKGETRPEDLPEGVVFEKIPSPDVMKRMTNEHLDSSTPLRKLLSVWRDFTNCPIGLDTLVDAAEQLRSKAQLPADAIGSLDCIDGITLHHVTCHKHTVIDLAGVRGIIALEGPNGSGKTTAIEAIPLAFFGTAPSRKDLQTLIPQDSDGVGFIELAFHSSGASYIARRQFKKTPKTFKHEAYLFKLEDYNSDNPEFEKAIAGPKVEDVKNRCIGLIGDPSLVFAGNFASQTESGDLVDLDPSDRKELFAKLLGSDKYLVLSEMAKEKAKADNAIIEAHKSRVERLKMELADEENDENTVATLKVQIAAANSETEKGNEALAEAQEVLAGLDVLRKNRDKMTSDLAEIEARKGQIKADGMLIKAQKAKLEESETRIKELEEDLSTAREAKEELDGIVAAQAEAEKKASEIRQKSSAKAMEATKLRAALRDQKSKWELKKASALSALRTKRSAGRKSLDEDVNSLNLEVQAKRTEAETAKKRSKLLEGFPDVDACKSCPLAKDGIEARESLQEIVKQGKALVAKLEAAKKALSDYDAETETMEAEAQEQQPTEADIDTSLDAKADEAEEESERLSTEASKVAPKPDAKHLADLKIAAAAAKSAEAALDQAKGARIEIAKIDAKLDALRSEFKKLDDQAKAIVVPVVPDDVEARAKVTELKNRIKDLQATASAASRALGSAEAALVAHQKRKDEAKSLVDVIKEKDDAIGVYNALWKAFSKDGIPQLIVDSAVPHYQDVMAKLMVHFGGKWSIQASTQKEVNKGASVKETFDIIVDDGHGGRDIKTYSGGEKRLLKNVTRVAFSLLQAERSGKGLKVLALDEATENMDHVNIDSFLKMLNELSDSFNQVFVISHNDYVLSSMPNRILFSRSGWPNEWATVETSFSSIGAK
jgi:DNA repair exonuclease SbcCD ATPase subunit/DNA repair exonuclease SbcCD nuclease subunit